jgi:hypothetical protein
MTASEQANLPRWHGQAGFYEFWFLVVFEPDAGRAYWFRYTILAPLAGVAMSPAATLWAAFFDLGRPDPVAFKRILPLADFDRGPADRFSIGIGPARLGHGHCSGGGTIGSRHYGWDLRFVPASLPEHLEPALLRLLPLPAHVARPNADVTFEGTVTVEGERRRIDRAPGLQFHAWGTRLPEELRWVRCPSFIEEASARLEALSVRLDRRLPGGIPAPWLSPISLSTRAGEIRLDSLPRMLRTTSSSHEVGAVSFSSETSLRQLRVRAWCEPRRLAGYVYRDPSGRELHVAQTDVGSCEVEIRSRPHPLARWVDTGRLTNRGSTAIEFHAPEPLPGVRYIAWDAERLA